MSFRLYFVEFSAFHRKRAKEIEFHFYPYEYSFGRKFCRFFFLSFSFAAKRSFLEIIVFIREHNKTVSTDKLRCTYNQHSDDDEDSHAFRKRKKNKIVKEKSEWFLFHSLYIIHVTQTCMCNNDNGDIFFSSSVLPLFHLLHK